MGLFSPNFRTQLAALGGGALFNVIDVGLPAGAGGSMRLSDQPVSHALQVVDSVGAITAALTERPSDLSNLTVSVAVSDKDRAMERILCGRYDCRRSAATIRWGLPGLDEEDWYSHFVGILDDWTFRNTKVELRCTTDNRQFEGFIPRKQILKGAFPGAPTKSLGVYCPIVIGIHNAQGLTTKGMVPTIPISISADTSLGYKYMVSLGTMKAVPRVYKNGTLLTLTTDYTIVTESRGGLTYTAVKLVNSSVATDEITCDVEGVTTDGTAAGSLITLPTEAWRWFLNNVVYGDWGGGAYVTATPIDEPSFSVAGSYCSTFKKECARYFGGDTKQDRAQNKANEFLKSEPMLRARWSNDGKIGIKVLDHRFDPYPTAYRINSEDDVSKSFEYVHSASGIVSKVALEYLYGESDSKFWQALEVQDLERWQQEKVTENFQLHWAASRFQ